MERSVRETKIGAPQQTEMVDDKSGKGAENGCALAVGPL